MRPNNFDLLRLMAALQVVYCHTCHHLDVTTGLGNPTLSYFINWFPGVPIFFTISGFLISRSWERTADWRDYAANRILRIYPALWFQLAIGILMLACFGAITPKVASSPSFFAWILAQATCAQFYSAQFLRDFGLRALNGSLWTIPVELGFYVLLPVLYFGLVNRLPRKWADGGLAVLSLASFAYWFHLSKYADEESIFVKLQIASPLPHLYMFLIGVLLQRNFERIRPMVENRASIWLAAFAIYMLAFNPWGMGRLSDSPLAVLGGRILLAATALSFAFSWRSLSERALQGNDISYGVYLYHAFGIHLLTHFGWKGTSLDLGLVTLATAIMATLSWRWIEKPAVSMKSKRPRNHVRPTETAGELTPLVEAVQPERRAA